MLVLNVIVAAPLSGFISDCHMPIFRSSRRQSGRKGIFRTQPYDIAVLTDLGIWATAHACCYCGKVLKHVCDYCGSLSPS